MSRIRWGYLVALVPIATDWVDTGHFPVHPREVVTEVIVGLILAAFVHALYRDADRYRALSETDPLTGLPNRRRFEADLALAVSRAGGAPLAVGFADVDEFKEINDTRGHEAGDEVLRAVGQALRSSFRRNDGTYRIGGDEFAVILPGATVADARVILSEALHVPHGSSLASLGVSLSIGIEEHRPGESVPLLLRRCDASMYEAKAARRRAAVRP
jgi:two-component system, cell cycle response regulator